MYERRRCTWSVFYRRKSAHFTIAVDSWMQYFHDFCYVGPKYLVPDQDKLATSSKGAAAVGSPGTAYYQVFLKISIASLIIWLIQWVPYLLIVQVILFYIPKALWQSGSYNYGNGLFLSFQLDLSYSYRP